MTKNQQSCPIASPVHLAHNILFKYIPPNHPCPSNSLASTLSHVPALQLSPASSPSPPSAARTHPLKHTPGDSPGHKLQWLSTRECPHGPQGCCLTSSPHFWFQPQLITSLHALGHANPFVEKTTCSCFTQLTLTHLFPGPCSNMVSSLRLSQAPNTRDCRISLHPGDLTTSVSCLDGEDLGKQGL